MMMTCSLTCPRNRGARPVIEYNAVYVGHLPFVRRAAVKLLALGMNSVGQPLMERMLAADAADDAIARGRRAKARKARVSRTALLKVWTHTLLRALIMATYNCRSLGVI